MKSRVAYCKCGHEVTRHALVDGKHQGVCLHGCGCTALHGRRRRGFHMAIGDRPEPSRQPSIDVALAALDRARAAIHEAEKALRAAPGNLRVVRSAESPLRRSSAHGSTKGERRILIAVAERPLGATRQQLTVLTGYKRSSRDTYLQRLRAAGHVVGAGTESDRICATEAGIAFLGSNYKPLPKGPALIEYWRDRLSGGELLIFDALLRARPNALSRDEIAESTGYRRSSRDTYLQRLRGRGIALVRSDGSVLLHQEFWGTPEREGEARG